VDRCCSQSPVLEADREGSDEAGFGLAETLMAVAVLAIVLVMAIPGILLSQSVVLRSDGTEDVRAAAMGAVEALRMVPFGDLDDTTCAEGSSTSVLCDDRVVTVNGNTVRLETEIEAVPSEVTDYVISGDNLKRVEVTATLESNPSRVWTVSTLIAIDGQVTIESSPDGGSDGDDGDGGNGSGSPSATVSDPPTNVAATAGNQSAVVTWTAPADNGGADITSYRATAADGQGNLFTCQSTSPNPDPLATCTISGLANGTIYSITAHATNSVGDSAAGSAYGGVVPGTVPDAPTAVTGVAGDALVVVSWTAPSDQGREISAYTVTASPGGATCSPDPVDTTCTVTGLTNGVEYTFTVTATNAFGQGEPSAASAGVTPQSPQTSIELRVNVTKMPDTSVPADEWPTIVVYDADGTAIAASGTDGNDYLFDIADSGTYQIAADVDGQVMPALFDYWQVDGEIYHAASQTQRRAVTIDVSGGDVAVDVDVFKPVILVLRATQMGQPTFLNPLTATISLGGQQVHQDDIVQGQSDPCNTTQGPRLFAWAAWFHCMYRRAGGFYFQPGTYSVTFSSPGLIDKTVGGVAPRAANNCASEWNAAYGSGACRYTTYAAGLDANPEAPTWVRVVDDTGWGVGASDVCVTITSGETCYVTDAAGYAEVTVDSSTGSGNTTTFEISSSGSGYDAVTTITQHVNAATYNDSAAAPLDLVLPRGNMKVHHLISRAELDHIDVRIKSGDSGAHSWYSQDLAPYEVVNGSSITLGTRVAGTSIDAAEWSDCSSGTDWCWRAAVASYQPDLRVGFYSYCGSHDLPLEDGHDLNELGTQLRYRWHRWNALSATAEKQVDTSAGCG